VRIFINSVPSLCRRIRVLRTLRVPDRRRNDSFGEHDVTLEWLKRKIVRARQMLTRNMLAHGTMPLINFRSRRAFVQFRPDFLRDRHEEFLALQTEWERVHRGNNRGDYARLIFLLASIEALEKSGLPGAFAELGVYRGSTAKIFHRLAPDRLLYLFDTFEGFAAADTSADPSRAAAGTFACSLAQVQRYVGHAESIRYCKGRFPETAGLVAPEERFALVHVDCDLYEPTKAALEFFYPRLVEGGLFIVHDYYSGCWPGVAQAVDEFLRDRPEGVVRIPDKSGTAVFVKCAKSKTSLALKASVLLGPEFLQFGNFAGAMA